MIWNQYLASIIVLFFMTICIVLMLIKKKKLDRGSTYFILAIALLTIIELSVFIGKNYIENFPTIIFYVIGVNLVVFLLYFLYFHQLLKSKKLRTVNLILIILFLLNYIISAYFDEHFFTRFPFFSYFVEVVLLTASIYSVMSQTFNSDKILTLTSYFPFWVCLSLLVIYLGVLPLLIVSFTAAINMNVNLFNAILFLVNIIGYLILLFGIFKAKTET